MTLWIPLKFSFDKCAIPFDPSNQSTDLVNQSTDTNWVDQLGQSLIQNISFTIGDDSYEWEPIEGCGYKVKGPRTIEWKCSCGCKLIDLSQEECPKVCPVCNK